MRADTTASQHFYRVFRNATAMAPNDWRAMHRKI
jgi:AraC-like DNA-binding protein